MRELDREEHRWLCALSGKLSEKDLKELIININGLSGKMEKEYADSVLEIALKANRELAEKIRSDENMSKTLMEIMEPVISEVITEVSQNCKEEGRKEGKKEGMVYAYYEMNLPAKEIARKLLITESEVMEIIKRNRRQGE
ncbi:MAG: hypothetical protein K1W24_14675 [Lachnospiraceae bacterium]